MANKHLSKIFLSASIPYENRDAKFFKTADIIAIRDAVRALATVVIPKAELIWGGHPAITPLIRYVMTKINADLKTHVTLYQSNFFRDVLPVDNFAFENIRFVKEANDRKNSLIEMRNRMIIDNEFSVGIFIGGMEGVLEEYELFKKVHPAALMLPVASTGAAAKIIYNQFPNQLNHRLLNDYAYMALFRDLLKDYLID
jgi:hypothetical protein